MSGPLPKRSDQRRRRNKTEGGISSAPLRPAEKLGPELDFEEVHQLAADWYESLRTSGQAVYFADSDWQQARIWTDLLSRQLSKGSPSAMMIAAWSSASSELLTTEGARRRLRLELERVKPADEDEDAAVAKIDEYRKRLAN